MTTAAPALTNFNGGELSPLLEGRVDFQKYGSGARTLDNFEITVQGPVKKRAGTRFVAEVKDSTKRPWLSTFEFNVTNAYTIEFGDLYARFYTQHGQLVSGGSPVEVVTPYAQANLFNADGTCILRTAQSADFLYITHGSYQPQTLQRLTATSFAMAAYQPKGGPFKDLNSSATTVYASAQTGAGITLTASSSIFQAGHVGTLFLLEAKNTNAVKAWEVGAAIVIGDRRRVSNRVYQALNNATTGSATPVHTVGALYDGNNGVQWQFQDPGYGWVTITAQAGTTATADVVQQLPADCVGAGNPTTRWAFAAWSSVEGWPTNVAFFRERLWFFRGQSYWSSVAGDFTDFSKRDPSGQVTADMAITGTISSGKINSIQWAVADKFLIVGTAGGEFAIGELTNGNPIGPGNIRSPLQSQFGSRAIVPAQAGASVLFVQRAGRKVRELAYDSVGDGYQSTDRTALSEHVTKSGIIDLDYAQEPNSVVWCTRADGKLIGFTWNSEQNVWGWHPHSIGGTAAVVESVAVIPSPNQATNELWLIVRRLINGTTKRYIEFMETQWEGGDSSGDAFYVDCGLTYNGASTSVISGLSHLEGQVVNILSNGAPHPQRTVVAGSITLQAPTPLAQVGLPYAAKFQSMRPEAGAANGTAQGKTKRISKVTYRFKDTSSGKYGPSFDKLDGFVFRSTTDAMDAPVPAFTGDKLVDWPGGYDVNGFVCFYDDQPLPVTLVGIFPTITTQDAR